MAANATTAVTKLTTNQLRRQCDPASFTFETTADIDRTNGIFGQPRGVRALEFGIGIQSKGYNIFVLGDTGTGRTTAIRRFLREKTRDRKRPLDWVYVHNFKVEHQPRAIEFPAGQGAQFKKQMEELVTSLRDDLPKAFATPEYQDEVDSINDRLELRQNLLLRSIEQRAHKQGFAIVRTAEGMTATPFVDGQVMTHEQYAMLSLEEQDDLDRNQMDLEIALQELQKKYREVRSKSRDEVAELDRRVAEQAIAHHVTVLTEMYSDHDEVLLYLSEVHDDVLANLGDFRPNPNTSTPAVPPDLRRFEVNMFIDNSRTEGAPVIVEQQPNYNNLIGRIEYEMKNAMMSTHFTYVKPGGLHRANGGYLVLEANDLLHDPFAWDALKGSLKTGKIVLRASNTLDGGGRVLAKTIDPEAIPLNAKVILLGSTWLYYQLWDEDEDFRELFKVKADFNTEMERDHEHELEYAHFIASVCNEEKLLHLNRGAVARLVEYGSELCGHQNKLSARFGALADVVRESHFWAMQRGATVVACEDVQRALDEREYRSNKLENEIDREIAEGVLMISTSGEVVGQINGLSILEIGDYAFGRPSRITARTFAGSSGVVHIERETEMADPIHTKGVLTLNGYLGGQYGQDQPLSFAASITFEQSYSGIGGDSASSTELYALLSSLGEVPLKQGIAVTGSINQLGEIQPIGGVTEKVEGFFRVCKEQGLTGEQGVIIPRSNVNELMLTGDVVLAVEQEQFHIWAIDSAEQGLEILTGLPMGERDEDGDYPADSLHGKVVEKLAVFAEKAGDSADSDDADSD